MQPRIKYKWRSVLKETLFERESSGEVGNGGGGRQEGRKEGKGGEAQGRKKSCWPGEGPRSALLDKQIL